jgi:hypothetical protein
MLNLLVKNECLSVFQLIHRWKTNRKHGKILRSKRDGGEKRPQAEEGEFVQGLTNKFS